MKPIVSICCLAYNHAKYIRQCLDGFIMQKTNFAFEVLIHDDASTDGTADIIREYELRYPGIIKPIYQKYNQYSKGVKVNAKYNYSRAQGKYIALCEGDDYWIDPLKLQKQVDYLEIHGSCALVHTNFMYLYEQKNKEYIDKKQNDYNNTILKYNNKEIQLKILDNNTYRVTTVTAMFRKESYLLAKEKYPLLFSSSFLMGDTQLWIALLEFGDIYYFPEVTSVYRKHEGSATFGKKYHDILKFKLSVSEMRFFISQTVPGLLKENSKYKKDLEVNLCKYITFDLEYSSFIIDMIKNDNDFLLKLLSYIKKYRILQFFIRSYFSIYDQLRLIYRNIKQIHKYKNIKNACL